MVNHKLLSKEHTIERAPSILLQAYIFLLLNIISNLVFNWFIMNLQKMHAHTQSKLIFLKKNKVDVEIFQNIKIQLDSLRITYNNFIEKKVLNISINSNSKMMVIYTPPKSLYFSLHIHLSIYLDIYKMNKKTWTYF